MVEESQEFYVATKNIKGDFVVYCSDIYKLSEIDLINLIKICIIERRSQKIGEKILEAYRDSTQHRKEEVQDKLNKIGIKNNADRQPTRVTKSSTR